MDVAPWVRCSMSSAPNALMAGEFVHLMHDSTDARGVGQHRFEACFETSSRFAGERWADERSHDRWLADADLDSGLTTETVENDSPRELASRKPQAAAVTD